MRALSRRKIGCVGMLAAALLCLSGVGPTAAQTLTVIRQQDSAHYDPHRTTAVAAAELLFLMGDTLVSVDWDMKTIRPGLAESWTVSPDGKTYTFKLRQDASFCSGRKLTAADVVYSFKRLTDPELKAPWTWRAGDVKEVRAPDPYTVEYELKEPFSELLINLTNFQATIINQENVEALGKDFGVKGFDGTGPWCWQSWEPRTQMVLTRHAAYKWGPPVYKNAGPVKFEKMVLKIIPEEGTRVAALMAGQGDLSYQMPPQFFDQLRAAPNLQVSEAVPYFSLLYIGFKIDHDVVSDPRVRKAFNMAVNKQDVVDAVYAGNAKPADTFVSPDVLDYDGKANGLLGGFDPEGAKKLLDEAGWKMGADGFREKDGKRLKPLLYGLLGGRTPKMVEAVQGSLRKVGVDLQLQLWDATIGFSKIATQEFDMWSISFPYVSAGDALNLYFLSKNRPTPNRMNWNDPDTDKWLGEGKAALTDADRAAAFAKVQERVTGEALWMPIAHERLLAFASKKVKNLRAHGNYGCALYKALDVSF